MKKNKVIFGILALVVVVGVIVGIAMSSKKNNPMNMASSTNSAVATNMVTIKDYMFGPASIKIKAGTKVTWTNQDAVNHTITADTSSSDAPNSMDIAKGQSYSFTFTKAGTYTYHCFPHPYMHGTVTVE
jgi:amicyanin